VAREGQGGGRVGEASAPGDGDGEEMEEEEQRVPVWVRAVGHEVGSAA
jgi:hypothetical protein